MQVDANTGKLQKLFSDRTKLVKEFGLKRAETIMQRISELRAAECLDDMQLLPGADFHELHQNRKGQFAVNALYPYRLIVTPVEPVPKKQDGGIDLQAVNGVILIEVVDYHGT